MHPVSLPQKRWLISVALAAMVLAVFWGVGSHPFIPYDDDQYVEGNPAVRGGLTWEGAAWAFGTFHKSNWHPLTWLSHMLDVEWFGLDPGWHHRVNLALHALNTILLFHVLAGMTGDVWRSAFVAALFGIHPLHVESVAWVAERKDVLSTVFGFLTLWAYSRYVERGGKVRYATAAGCYVLGLLSKPMLVTLPFVLLLLDHWPLRRLAPGAREGGGDRNGVPPRWILAEKIPFFLLAFASAAVTFLAQGKGGAVAPADLVPVPDRVANAALSYAGYLGKLFWPGSLAIFYPHPRDAPGGIVAWQVAGSILLLAAVSWFSIHRARRQPYLAVGWFWYLGTLVPVIGLVQVGSQGMADRYTYVPSIGVFLMIAWGIPEALAGCRHRRRALAISAGAVLAALMAATRVQVSHWRSGAVLFGHALKVTSNNWVMHNNLGSALAREGRTEEAAKEFRKSVRIHPDDAISRYNLGSILLEGGDYDGAILHLRESVRLRPDYSYAHANLGYALLRRGKRDEAVAHFREALALNPGDPLARQHLETALRME